MQDEELTEKTALEIALEAKEQVERELAQERSQFEREKIALTKARLDNNPIVEVVDPTPSRQDLEQKAESLRNKLRHPDNLTNLEAFSASLELRDITLELTGEDDYQPHGEGMPEGHGEKVATVLRQIIERSEGSPERFNGEYAATIKDNPNYVALAASSQNQRR